MPQTHSRFFDDLSRLMTDAAGLADGARREAQTFARTQMERMMAGMDIVTREEFEAVKEMAARARDDNEKLAQRIAALEAKLSRAKALIGLAFLSRVLIQFADSVDGEQTAAGFTNGHEFSKVAARRPARSAEAAHSRLRLPDPSPKDP